MTRKKFAKRMLLILGLILIIGRLPYRPAFFADTKNMLLVKPTACGGPCADVQILNGSVIIPQKFLDPEKTIYDDEVNLINCDAITENDFMGEYYTYYISGKVVGIEPVEGNEMAPIVDVERCYLTQYVAI